MLLWENLPVAISLLKKSSELVMKPYGLGTLKKKMKHWKLIDKKTFDLKNINLSSQLYNCLHARRK
ncbi:MAG: hypothetical protein Ct9H300mP28_00830 [Pseudomonadota bacterium]|nr:MAG: hypothetical protein Ct9H300mP28_00830 [Pseudomonadota bacterium]